MRCKAARSARLRRRSGSRCGVGICFLPVNYPGNTPADTESRGTADAYPQREPLGKLSRTERTALEQIVRGSSERVDVVRRATALLAVARTGVRTHAAHEAGLHSGTTVADLVARFNRHGLAALRIAMGRGRRPTYSASERARVVATAQRQPQRRTDGTATWSLSTLQRRLRRSGLPQVGTSTIRRVLQDAGSSYQRTRTWCPTGTALRKRKSGMVTVVDPKTEAKRG